MSGHDSDAWLLWQLADSAFPSGGFAHSGGLEAAWQQGEIGNRAELDEYLVAALTQAGRGALPFVGAGHADPEAVRGLDFECEAFLLNSVGNKASRLQGQSFLAAVERGFASPAMARLRGSLAGAPCHLAPVFGAALRLLEIQRVPAQRLFLFIALRGWIAAAVRLGMIGPLEAQGLQFRLGPVAESVCRRFADLPVAAAAQTSLLLDILHSGHERLYSRLFQT